MRPNYNLQWLTDKFDKNEVLKFLFFWGHKNDSNTEIGKSCFSQWFELPFVVDGITYATAEHWMMANKALLFDDRKTHDKIIRSKSPAEAKELGRQILGFDDQIWVANSLDIVIIGNIHKFNQNINHARYLENTKDRILVEASPVDTIWGIGLAQDNQYITNPYFWRGQNLLGFALMEVRDFFTRYGHFKNLENIVNPPWRDHPNIDSHDLFWRMGVGEEAIMRFSNYYSRLSKRDKTIFELTNPAPYNWKDFYN